MDISLIWKILKNLPIILPLIKQLIDLFGSISDKTEKKTLADKIKRSVAKKDHKQIGSAYQGVIKAAKRRPVNPKL